MIALRDDGTLWTWGGGVSAPTPFLGTAKWKAIAAGSDHSVALREGGTLWTWGANNRGQLGVGSTTPRTGPQLILSSMRWKAIAAGGNNSAAIREDGTLWTWGDNEGGQIGNGSGGLGRYEPSPRLIETNTTWKRIATGGLHYIM